jgi:hypothetical protein
MVIVGNINKAGNLYNFVMLHTLLQRVAYFLNHYSYNDSSTFDAEEVMDGFIAVVETFYHGDYDKENKVPNEDLHRFKDQVGHFSKQVALWL